MGAEVKWISSSMPGAPVLSGTAGALNTVFDACLVNGFGLVTVTNLVVAGGVATATVGAGHGFIAGRVVLLAGATPAGLNGEKRIVSVVSAGVFTFDATGIADQVATGTMSAKVAPLGWERTSANSPLGYNYYRSLDQMGSRYGMMSADVGTTVGYVNGYERLTSAGIALAAPMANNPVQWNKSVTANATARPWHLIGDSRGFYLLVAAGTSATNYTTYFFGDPLSRKSGDIFGAMVTGSATSQIGAVTAAAGCLGVSDRAASAVFVSRALGAALASPVQGQVIGAGHLGATSPAFGGSAAYTPIAYPNTPDNALLLFKVYAIFSGTLRATFPGFYHSGTIAGSVGPIMSGELAGRTMQFFNVAAAGGGTGGLVYFDVTGPWR